MALGVGSGIFYLDAVVRRPSGLEGKRQEKNSRQLVCSTQQARGGWINRNGINTTKMEIHARETLASWEAVLEISAYFDLSYAAQPELLAVVDWSLMKRWKQYFSSNKVVVRHLINIILLQPFSSWMQECALSYRRDEDNKGSPFSID